MIKRGNGNPGSKKEPEKKKEKFKNVPKERRQKCQTGR